MRHDDFQQRFACMGNKQNLAVAVGGLFLFFKNDKDVAKELDEFVVIAFKYLARRTPGPTTFQFDIPLITSVISSPDGSSLSHYSSGRGGIAQ